MKYQRGKLFGFRSLLFGQTAAAAANSSFLNDSDASSVVSYICVLQFRYQLGMKKGRRKHLSRRRKSNNQSRSRGWKEIGSPYKASQQEPKECVPTT